MKVVAAYLLAVLGGNATPSAGDLKDILSSVGAEADDDRIELLLTQVKNKDITELIAAGREKLASVPAGGGAVAVAASAAGGGGGAAAPAAAEPKKEEKVEEKEESDDVSLLCVFTLSSPQVSERLCAFLSSCLLCW
ncbi:UNVERIFIED_CONTAM: 60S acidic ribosomal protein P2 [Sesamum radiatum]|uniref:60S acidic ribosomal protein P2 n=1 Tax=Sesamum radiatum TaxID=300843 RepID=A0AAW2KRF8_SESRA